MDRKIALDKLQIIRNELPNVLQAIQAKEKLHFDKSHKHVEYLPNQLVLLKKPPSLSKRTFQPKFDGPFKIIKKISDVNYQIEVIKNNVSTLETFHVRRLKPYFSSDQNS